MKKYTYEINGKEVNEIIAKMSGNYTLVEWTIGKYGWEYNGHYTFNK